MLIGGSCGGRFSRPIQGTTCYENRILQRNEHKYFWDDCKFCLENNILLLEVNYYKDFKSSQSLIKQTIDDIKKSYEKAKITIPNFAFVRRRYGIHFSIDL